MSDTLDDTQDLSKLMFESIKRIIPPRKSSFHLEDISMLLMEALSRGDIYVEINKTPISNVLKGKGWPIEHIKQLKESGWLDGDNSPIVMTGNHLSWRRWHEEMEIIINNLKNRSLQQSDLIANNNDGSDLQTLANLNSQQYLATKAISKKKLKILSGGTGTGIINTIVRMIINALSPKSDLRIGIALKSDISVLYPKLAPLSHISIPPEPLDSIFSITFFMSHGAKN